MHNKDLERHRRALASVANNGDYMAHLKHKLETARSQLELQSDAIEVYRLQGACRAITDLINELSRA